MSGAAWGVVGALVSGLLALTGSVWVKRIDASTVKDRTVVDGMRGLIAELREQQDRDRKSATEAIDGLRRELEDERQHSRRQDRSLTTTREQLTQLRRAIRQHVLPLIQWLDSGAEPPAPGVAAELRALVADDPPSD